MKRLYKYFLTSFTFLLLIDPMLEANQERMLVEQLSHNKLLNNFEVVGKLYHQVHYQTIWNQRALEELLDVLKDPSVNYTQKEYHQKRLQSFLKELQEGRITEEKRIELDLLASDAFISSAKDFAQGRVDTALFQELLQATQEEKALVWEVNSKRHRYLKELQQALKQGSIEEQLRSYPPQDRDYKALVSAYHRYKKISFPKIDYLKNLHLGDYGYEVSQLKHYLKATGDLNSSDRAYLEFPTFDEKLQNAVKRFQKRHYLKVTGVFDRVNALYARRSAKEKLEQISLNIERHKLYAPIDSLEYIVINIPSFSLKYYRDGALLRDIFVVIGREDRPTPIFKDYLEYIVLNPTWSIPQNLMKKDYIPHLIEDPYALREDEIEIFYKGRKIDPAKVNWQRYLDYEGTIPYQMVQKAGEKNVLGEMKFIFPNRYNVYLHDTNAKHLTTRRYRLYSSGCIRLSKPYALLEILAPYTGYDFESLVDIIASKKSRTIPLRKKIPIHIRYNTVFVDEEGAVHFRRDFYGLDKITAQALNN